MTAARLVVVALLTAVAAVPFALLFGGRGHLGPLAGAVLVPCAVGGGLALAAPQVAGWARRVGILLVLAIPVLLLTGAGAEVVHGPARLLTAALPVEPGGPELAAAVLAVGVTALAGTELALRPARSALAAAVPAAVCYTAGLALGASGPRPPAALATGLVAGGGVLLALDSGRGHRAPAPGGPRLVGADRTSRQTPLPRLAAATLVVAAATVLASLLSPWTPGASARGRPFDARDLVAAPVVPRTSVSPLADLPVLRSGPLRTLFTVPFGAKPGQLLRAATLTQFDGHLWTTGGIYRRAGQVLPAPPPAGGAPNVRSRMRVEVADPAAVTWLPTGGRGVRVSVAGLGVDPATGDLVVPAGQHAPDTYTVTSVEPDIGNADLPTAVVAPHEQPAPPAAGSPELARLRAAAAEVAGTRDTAFAQVAALSEMFERGFAALRAGAGDGAAVPAPAAGLHQGAFGLSRGPGAPAGHGLSQIGELLASGRGTAEQYASAGAVVARQLGYDARVVVGYQVPRDLEESGRYEATNRDAHAWIEVRMLGVGWVPFDVTPSGGGTSGGDEQAPPDAASQAESGANKALDNPPGAGGGDRLPAAPPAAGGGGLPWQPLVALAVALALTPVLAAAVLPVAGAAVRFRRRRLPDPARRVAGAWREALDRLVEHGLPVTPAMTSGEVVTAGGSLCAPPVAAGLADLARMVDAAGYGPDPADDARAAAAWRLTDRLRPALAAQLPRHRRILQTVDPRIPALRLAAARQSHRGRWGRLGPWARWSQRMRRMLKAKRPWMK